MAIPGPLSRLVFLVRKSSSRVLAAALAGAAALSSCSLPGTTGPHDATSPGATGTSPSGAIAGVMQVEPSLAGATTYTFTAAPQQVSATIPRFANARTLSIAAEVVRNRMLRGAWESDAKKVTVTSQVVASSDAVIGLQEEARVTTNSGVSTIPATIWYSASTKRAYSSPALITSAQWAGCLAALTRAAADAKLDSTKLAKLLAQPAAPYGSGPAMAFTKAGDLVTTFRSGALGSDATSLTIPAEQATPLLSVLGAQAQKASMSPTAFTGTTTQAKDPELAKGVVGARPSTAIGPDCRVLHCVAITYDDGPSAMTPTLLASIKKAKVSITFFQTGNSIQEYPKIAQQVAAAGMEIGNHTVTHPNLPSIPQQKMAWELNRNSEIIKGFTGATPLLFRPPYGAHNARVDAVAKADGMSIIQWEIDTEDWRTHSVSKTAASASSAPAYRATIVLEHDIQKASVDAAPQIYRNLAAKGMTIVSVSELSLNSGGYLAGHAYCRGTAIAQEGFNCLG